MNEKNFYTRIHNFFSIIMIFILALSFFCGSYIFHLTETNYNNLININLEENYQTLETKLEIFNNLNKILFKNAAIDNYANNSNINEYYSYLLIVEQIHEHSEILAPLCASISITDFKDKVFTPGAAISKKDFLSEFPISTEFLQAADENGILAEVNPLYYTFIYKHKYLNGNNMFFIINVEKKHFSPVDTNGVMEIADKNSSKTFDSEKITKAFSNVSNSTYSDAENGVFIRNSQHVKNMIYLYEPHQNKSHLYFLLMFISLYVLLIIFRKRIINWLSVSLYRPLDNIFNTLGDSDSSGDIEFLNHSIHKLLEDNKALKTNLTKKTYGFKDIFIKNLLHGNMLENDIETYIENFDLSLFKHNLYCIVIDFTDDCSDNVVNVDALQNNYAEILKKFLANNLSGELVAIDKFKFCFITPEIKKSVLIEKIFALQEVINTFTNTRPFIAVGRTVTSFKDIHKSFNDATELISKKFNYSETSLVFFDTASANKTTYYYPIELENHLINSILYGKTEAANTIIAELINTNLYELSLNKENLTEFKFAITATIKRIVYMLNKSTTEVFGEDNIVYLDISHASTNEEIDENIHRIINNLHIFIENNQKNNRSKYVADILNYISENYNKDLSLNDVAEHLDTSTSHITRTLAQYASTSFKEYLNKKRIEVAKEQLLNTNINTDKISENVGFTNTRTFFRVFKKYTGCSPTEYRKANSVIQE